MIRQHLECIVPNLVKIFAIMVRYIREPLFFGFLLRCRVKRKEHHLSKVSHLPTGSAVFDWATKTFPAVQCTCAANKKLCCRSLSLIMTALITCFDWQALLQYPSGSIFTVYSTVCLAGYIYFLCLALDSMISPAWCPEKTSYIAFYGMCPTPKTT